MTAGARGRIGPEDEAGAGPGAWPAADEGVAGPPWGTGRGNEPGVGEAVGRPIGTGPDIIFASSSSCEREGVGLAPEVASGVAVAEISCCRRSYQALRAGGAGPFLWLRAAGVLGRGLLVGGAGWLRGASEGDEEADEATAVVVFTRLELKTLPWCLMAGAMAWNQKRQSLERGSIRLGLRGRIGRPETTGKETLRVAGEPAGRGRQTFRA